MLKIAMEAEKSIPHVVLIDGYIDDPAALGVPPYISPMIRAVAGAAVDAGGRVTYLSIDMLRQGREIPDADVTVLLSGNTVPGKYLRSMPMSLKEIREYLPKMKGWKLIGGSSAYAPEAEGFDFRIHRDLAASLYDGMTGKEVGERFRTLDEWNRWMLLGADIVKEHQDFPQPLMVEIESYRGCHRYASGGCSFCIEPTKGKPLMRQPEDILAEAKKLRALGVCNIRVGGQTCIISYGSEDFSSGVPRPVPSKVRQLFEGLKALGFEHISVDNANPAVIATYPEESSEIIKILADNCSSGNVLALGLESADPAVREANNLNSTADQVLEAIRIINRYGAERGPTGLPKILPGLNIICGLEGETFETYGIDMDFLKRIVDEGLMVRRINIRQVIGSRREFHVKMNEKRFKKFKENVRENVDHPLLERMIPLGTVLTDVYAEIHDGNITFGRQPGSYPILVGIPYKVDLDRFYDVKITEWGFRSVTGITYPFNINTMPMSALSALPGIGKKRATTLTLKRPFKDLADLNRAIDDPNVIEGLRDYIVFDD
jgi:radical SAM superfamily enzyme with C-terminal helix-hairpin-helix motif